MDGSRREAIDGSCGKPGNPFDGTIFLRSTTGHIPARAMLSSRALYVWVLKTTFFYWSAKLIIQSGVYLYIYIP